MAEDVVEDVEFRKVVELLAGAHRHRGREAALCQALEESAGGDEAHHGNRRPPLKFDGKR